MIGQTLLRKSLAQSRYGAQVVSASHRSFAGGGNKPKPIDPKTTDYDILFVGKQLNPALHSYQSSPEVAKTTANATFSLC